MSAPVNVSNKALDGSLALAERYVSRAVKVQRVVQYSFLTVGLSTVIGLSAASSNSSNAETEQTIKVEAVEVNPIEVSLKGLDWPTSIPVDVNFGDVPSITVDPLTISGLDLKPEVNVEVAGSELRISGIPPGARDWHRTVFNNPGDEFWALPELDFSITLSKLRDNGCNKSSCTASFDFTSTEYLANDSPIEIQINDRTISALALDSDTQIDCRRLTFPYMPVLLCKLDNDNAAETSACLWIRRSEHPEQATAPQVALDVKWDETPRLDGVCPQWHEPSGPPN